MSKTRSEHGKHFTRVTESSEVKLPQASLRGMWLRPKSRLHSPPPTPLSAVEPSPVTVSLLELESTSRHLSFTKFLPWHQTWLSRQRTTWNTPSATHIHSLTHTHTHSHTPLLSLQVNSNCLLICFVHMEMKWQISAGKGKKNYVDLPKWRKHTHRYTHTQIHSHPHTLCSIDCVLIHLCQKKSNSFCNPIRN